MTIWTDGACHPNPGRGGWAALLRHERASGEVAERELFGWDPATTNNRMEMMGAIAALEALTRRCEVLIYSDSQLVVKGASEWIVGWRRRGFQRRKGELLNADLWRRLDEAQQWHDVEWRWVMGHSGVLENERVDGLAVRARVRMISSDPT